MLQTITARRDGRCGREEELRDGLRSGLVKRGSKGKGLGMTGGLGTLTAQRIGCVAVYLSFEGERSC